MELWPDLAAGSSYLPVNFSLKTFTVTHHFTLDEDHTAYPANWLGYNAEAETGNFIEIARRKEILSTLSWLAKHFAVRVMKNQQHSVLAEKVYMVGKSLKQHGTPRYCFLESLVRVITTI